MTSPNDVTPLLERWVEEDISTSDKIVWAIHRRAAAAYGRGFAQELSDSLTLHPHAEFCRKAQLAGVLASLCAETIGRGRRRRDVDMEKCARPMPEILRPLGHRWEVIDCSPSYAGLTSLEIGRMTVPCALDDKAARAVRLHEKLHLCWTPSNAPRGGVSDDMINAVEDARLMFKAQVLNPALRSALDETQIISGDMWVSCVQGVTDAPVAERPAALRTYVQLGMTVSFSTDGGYFKSCTRDALLDDSGSRPYQRAILRNAYALVSEARERLVHIPSGRRRTPPDKVTYEIGLKVAQWLERELSELEEAATTTATATLH